ncbi:MAG: hypothetical protein WBA93_33710 [Microcoleaceae cyanobacterium]
MTTLELTHPNQETGFITLIIGRSYRNFCRETQFLRKSQSCMVGLSFVQLPKMLILSQFCQSISPLKSILVVAKVGIGLPLFGQSIP